MGRWLNDMTAAPAISPRDSERVQDVTARKYRLIVSGVVCAFQTTGEC
jgi:hypothetical protein